MNPLFAAKTADDEFRQLAASLEAELEGHRAEQRHRGLILATRERCRLHLMQCKVIATLARCTRAHLRRVAPTAPERSMRIAHGGVAFDVPRREFARARGRPTPLLLQLLEAAPARAPPDHHGAEARRLFHLETRRAQLRSRADRVLAAQRARAAMRADTRAPPPVRMEFAWEAVGTPARSNAHVAAKWERLREIWSDHAEEIRSIGALFAAVRTMMANSFRRWYLSSRIMRPRQHHASARAWTLPMCALATTPRTYRGTMPFGACRLMQLPCRPCDSVLRIRLEAAYQRAIKCKYCSAPCACLRRIAHAHQVKQRRKAARNKEAGTAPSPPTAPLVSDADLSRQAETRTRVPETAAEQPEPTPIEHPMKPARHMARELPRRGAGIGVAPDE